MEGKWGGVLAGCAIEGGGGDPGLGRDTGSPGPLRLD